MGQSRTENLFSSILQGKVVIVGIGNPLRGDDGFGPALTEKLQGTARLICINAGSAPENYLGRIVKEAPDTILLVDVAHLELEPGQYRILQPVDISQCGLTTHDTPSQLLIEFLKDQTQADVFMLAVQPQNVSLGEIISEPLTKTLKEIEMLIQTALLHESLIKRSNPIP